MTMRAGFFVQLRRKWYSFEVRIFWQNFVNACAQYASLECLWQYKSCSLTNYVYKRYRQQLLNRQAICCRQRLNSTRRIGQWTTQCSSLKVSRIIATQHSVGMEFQNGLTSGNRDGRKSFGFLSTYKCSVSLDHVQHMKNSSYMLYLSATRLLSHLSCR